MVETDNWHLLHWNIILYLILFGLKAIRISVYSRVMSPLSVFTRHLTKSNNLWPEVRLVPVFRSVGGPCLSTSVSVDPYLAAGTILLLWLCSHCVVTILCGQAEIVQQVVRKESAIQTHYILHCIFCNLAKQEKMCVNRTSCENKNWGFETMLSCSVFITTHCWKSLGLLLSENFNLCIFSIIYSILIINVIVVFISC